MMPPTKGPSLHQVPTALIALNQCRPWIEPKPRCQLKTADVHEMCNRTLFTYPGIPSLKPKKARRPSGSVPPIHRPGYVFTLFSQLQNTKCHACHTKRSNATFETSKNDPFCRTYHRHGQIAITRTVANGCERLRTVEQRRANTPSTPRPPE